MSNTTLLLVSICVMLVVALPVAAIMKQTMPRVLERGAQLEQLENRIYVLHSEAHDVQDRVSGLVARRNQQSTERQRVESDIRKMEKTIAELTNQPPLFVHELGEPKMGTTRFVVTLMHEKSSSPKAGEKLLLNPIWRTANVAEVWAGSFEEARQMVETSFPLKLGFQKSFQKQAPERKAGPKVAAS